MSYLSIVPQDLVIPLFCYFSPREIIDIIHKCRNLKLPYNFWKTIWKRDISSFIEPPMAPNEAYEKYKEIIFWKYTSDIDRLYTLAEKGYDVLLYPLLLHVAHYESAIETAAKEGYTEMVKKLLESGKCKYTLIMRYAACKNYIELVKLVINSSADNNDFDYTMAFSSKTGNMDLIELMLQHGAKSYFSTMRIATANNHRHIVKRMLELIDLHKADYTQSALNNAYKDSLSWAKKNKNQSIFKLIKKARNKHIISKDRHIV